MVSSKSQLSYMHQKTHLLLIPLVLLVCASFNIVEYEFVDCDQLKVQIEVLDTKEGEANGEVGIAVFEERVSYIYVFVDKHNKVINKDYSLNHVKNLFKRFFHGMFMIVKVAQRK